MIFFFHQGWCLTAVRREFHLDKKGDYVARISRILLDRPVKRNLARYERV